LLNEKHARHEPEAIMPESESAALIEQLRRAKRRWKAVAISLSLVLTILLIAAGFVVIQNRLAAAVERERAIHAAFEAKQAMSVRQEKARKEAEKAPGP
jgi:hypothetical protein